MSNVPSLGSRGEGWLALQMVCFGLIAAAWWSAPRAPSGGLGLVLQIAALGVGIAGAAMIGSGIASLRAADALAAVPRPREGSRMAVSGAYRLVRHPIYGGLLLVGAAVALLAPWAGSIVAVAALGLVLDLKRRREEAWLADRYPDYQAYRRRTKALIPFLY